MRISREQIQARIDAATEGVTDRGERDAIIERIAAEDAHRWLSGVFAGLVDVPSWPTPCPNCGHTGTSA